MNKKFPNKGFFVKKKKVLLNQCIDFLMLIFNKIVQL